QQQHMASSSQPQVAPDATLSSSKQSFPPLIAPKPQKPSPIVSNNIAGVDHQTVLENYSNINVDQRYDSSKNDLSHINTRFQQQPNQQQYSHQQSNQQQYPHQ